MNPLVIGIKEAAEACGVSVWTLRRWIAEGQIATVQFPSTFRRGEKNRRVLISIDDLRSFRDRHRVVPPEQRLLTKAEPGVSSRRPLAGSRGDK